MCLKYCACRENEARVIRSAAPVTQNHLPKTEDLMLQNAIPLRISAPGPPNISDEHVSCIAPATENGSFQVLFTCPTPAIVFGNARKPSRFARCDKVHNPLRLPSKTTSERPKLSEHVVFFTFCLGCASCHNGVHFFLTSQLPKVVRECCALHILT